MARMRVKVMGDEAANSASRLLLEGDAADSLLDTRSDSLEDRFQKLEQDDRIESMLSELKLLSNQ
jgi:hypothetical protein